ncbi:MAG: hypothetical protein Q7V57_10345 [Actinomycetota bacterium]|nr:hypothetical protein [Actinomycetota bacterium]
MASSSSAKKVAKLASRGKGKKVRFSGGTTFPAIIAVVCLSMLALIVYAKASLPGDETGAPQPGDEWVAAYSFRVCDDQYTLTGTPNELNLDASTGNPDKLTAGTDNADGIIHYHPQTGGATGRKAKLGVFLDVYGVKLSNDKLELPEAQVGVGETSSWNVDDNIFEGTSCAGDDAVIKVRVWNDYTSGAFYDNVTDFRNLRLLRNGMVFVIAVVPNDYDIARPSSACDLEDFGAIGSGDLCKSGADTTTTVADTTPDTTVGTDGGTTTTAAGSTTTAASTTTTTG